MKWIHIIITVIGLVSLQYFQRSIAHLRLDKVLNGIDIPCDDPIDDRAELMLQRINIRHSDIHEFGVFANASIPCGAIIYDAYILKPVRVLEKKVFEFSFWGITNVFARVNHHHVPSARVIFHPESQCYVVFALREINVDEEITVV
jgi:hypothetical protein